MAKRYDISYEEACENLLYEPDTGVFRWKKDSGWDAKAGAQAGSVHRSGYRRIGVCGALVYAHRLAWLMHHGKPPADQIDHINGNRDDNRIANLRDANAQINSQNHVVTKAQRSSLVGVMSDGANGLWAAQVRFKGTVVRAGGFKTIEAAHSMYLELKRRLHDGFVMERQQSGHPSDAPK